MLLSQCKLMVKILFSSLHIMWYVITWFGHCVRLASKPGPPPRDMVARVSTLFSSGKQVIDDWCKMHPYRYTSTRKSPQTPDFITLVYGDIQLDLPGVDRPCQRCGTRLARACNGLSFIYKSPALQLCNKDAKYFKWLFKRIQPVIEF